MHLTFWLADIIPAIAGTAIYIKVSRVESRTTEIRTDCIYDIDCSHIDMIPSWKELEKYKSTSNSD